MSAEYTEGDSDESNVNAESDDIRTTNVRRVNIIRGEAVRALFDRKVPLQIEKA